MWQLFSERYLSPWPLRKRHLFLLAALGDKKNVPLSLDVIKLWVVVLPCSVAGTFNNDELSGIFTELTRTGFKIMYTVHFITFLGISPHLQNVIPASV